MRLSVTPRRIREKIACLDDGIRADGRRRLRNAVLALASLDPGWMWWIEKNIPKQMTLDLKTRQIERRARLKLAKRYLFLGWGWQLDLIYSDYYFTDDGNLKLYL
jgi:hypothetical protein